MKKKNIWSLVWFVFGFGIFVFTRMSKLVPTIPIAILIAPIFILRFSRTQPVGRGNLFTFLGFYTSISFGLWWLYETNTLFNIIKILILALLYALPFMIDRPLYERLSKNKGASGLATLTFPILTTAIHFLFSLEGFFEGTVQLGKFVFGPIVLQQLLSLFGISGFVFISAWFVSTINFVWEKGFAWNKTKKAIIALTAVTLAILVFGAIKLTTNNPQQNTVKAAAIILTPEDEMAIPINEMWAGRLVSPFEETISKIDHLTNTAALNGAKIVSFQELSMMINEERQGKLKEELQNIAKANDVYLSVSYGTYAKEGKGENVHILINNQGEVIINYTKRYVSGLAEFDIGEAGYFRKGPEVIQWADTPYGRIAISICRDLEMTDYIRQAGKANVDLMLSSAYEFEQGLVIHSSYMRTIEYGFSLLRPTQHGITIAVDYNGNVLNQMNFTDPGDGIMYADLPTEGIHTLYTGIGDMFGWISVATFLGLISLSVILSIKDKKEALKTQDKNSLT